MALTVGTDSYITLVDADAYLSSYHLSTDADMVAWAALSDANCEILLRRAARVIDRQPLVGIRADSVQTMEFPRAIYSDFSTSYNRFGGDYYIQDSVPSEVAHAQCEIALDLAANGQSERVKLQREGVRSFSLGSLSESYIGAGNDVLCVEAKTLLSPYLVGGVSIV